MNHVTQPFQPFVSLNYITSFKVVLRVRIWKKIFESAALKLAYDVFIYVHKNLDLFD